MSEKVVLRFAPSPSGYLHVGGARTALFNWLYARKHQGRFLLRIEDTDLERSSEEMAGGILEGLTWLGLGWDGEPVYQSHQLAVYRERVERLVEVGKAYPCFCPPEHLEEKRKAARRLGRPFRYEGTCSAIPPEEARSRMEEEPHALRLRVPREGRIGFEDLVHGRVEVENSVLDDFVLVRRSGRPTYNFAVVVDDLDQGVTHVLRGDDHLSNTPKQLHVYGALGAGPPRFGHLPLILGPDRERLSKRHGATSVEEFHRQGIHPDALVNFLALLGWSSGDDREFFTRKELLEAFSIEGVSGKQAVFDPQKLEWLNGQHLSRMSPEALAAAVRPFLQEAGLWRDGVEGSDREWYLRVLDLLKVRARRLTDIPEQGRFFFTDELDYAPDAVARFWKDEATADRLTASLGALRQVDDFSKEAVEQAVRYQAEALAVSASKLIHPLRVALTGQQVGPGVFELMVLLGQERCLRRIERALEHLASSPATGGDASGGKG